MSHEDHTTRQETIRISIKPKSLPTDSMARTFLGTSEMHLCDTIDLNKRRNDLLLIFKDLMSETTDGMFDWNTVLGKQRILDLGSGRGAFGSVLRSISDSSTRYLCGVEEVENYRGEEASGVYDRWVTSDLKNPNLWSYLTEEENAFDLIVAVGLPPGINAFLIQLDELKQLLSPGGHIMVVTDFKLPDNLSSIGWSVFHGQVHIDKNVAIFHKT